MKELSKLEYELLDDLMEYEELLEEVKKSSFQDRARFISNIVRKVKEDIKK